MIQKEQIRSILLRQIEKKITQLHQLIDELVHTNDNKSSAGDKHETGLAMAHLEQEKLSNQLIEASRTKEALVRIDAKAKFNKVCYGSLVETSLGTFYISVGIGALDIEGRSIFCMTPQAPLFGALMNKKAGESINWQGKEVRIFDVH